MLFSDRANRLNFDTPNHTFQLEMCLLFLYGFENIEWRTPFGGFSSINLHMVSNGSHWIVKRYGEVACRRLTELNELMLFLQTNQICAGGPIKNRRGSFEFLCDGATYAILPMFRGSILRGSEFNDKALISTAQLIAKFHRLGPFFPKKPRSRPSPQFSTVNFRIQSSALLNEIAHENLSGQILSDIYKSLEVKEKLLSKMVRLPEDMKLLGGVKDLLHGDFHNENILYNKTKDPACLLDFEHFGFGHRICDLMQFIQLALCNDDYNLENLHKGSLFLKAYSKVNELGNEDVRAGVNYSFWEMANSLFFERKLYETGNKIYSAFINRDLRKLAYYQENRQLLEAAFFI